MLNTFLGGLGTGLAARVAIASHPSQRLGSNPWTDVMPMPRPPEPEMDAVTLPNWSELT